MFHSLIGMARNKTAMPPAFSTAFSNSPLEQGLTHTHTYKVLQKFTEDMAHCGKSGIELSVTVALLLTANCCNQYHSVEMVGWKKPPHVNR